MQPETLLARAGTESDPVTGALSTPIHQSATFAHPRLGESTGYDYSRTANPTRNALEQVMAGFDGGARSCAFSSGMAALDAVCRVLLEGDRKTLIVTEDPYGGTVRLVDRLYRPLGCRPVYLDTSDTEAVERALARGDVAGVVLEIPTNPLLRVPDVAAVARAAHAAGALLAVDNTFLTPYCFRPFDHGADIAVYSATKYLSGHNDVVAGVATCRDPEVGARLAFVQNTTGAICGPMDSWLLLRGLKTLAVRMDRQMENALRLARFLAGHPAVSRVMYPGLEDDPGHTRLARQATGFGAMLSFEVRRAEMVPSILANVRVLSFAESLGGVESLITFPAVQTHADMDPALRERLGIGDRLLRVSVGIEHADDLTADLARVLDHCGEG